MSGTTYDVSARGNKMTTAVDLRRATKKALAELSALIAGGGNHIVDVAIASDGASDPSHNSSGSHPALVVMWRGMRIGALRAADSSAYAQLNRILASGFSPATVARVKKGPASGSAVVKIDVSLREPDVVVPVNNPPSSGNWVLMPSGNIIQVTGEDGHADYLRSILPASGRCQVLATLHAAKFGVRTKYDGVEVRLNGKRVGELSKAMGEKVLLAVDHFRSLGCATVSRAFIDGSGDVPPGHPRMCPSFRAHRCRPRTGGIPFAEPCAFRGELRAPRHTKGEGDISGDGGTRVSLHQSVFG